MTVPGQHAIYAPSSAHRWMRCTASAEAIAKLPPQEESEEAAKGTAAHEEIERCLEPVGYFANGLKPLSVNPAHASAHGVALVLDYVQQLPGDGSKMWIEQRVRLTDDIWGRCDVAHWHEPTGVLTIVDYKDGYVGVDAEENDQLRIYGAASIYTHNLPAQWIRYAVVQPNDFRPVPRVKQWVEPVESLHAFASKAAAVPSGPKSFVAGEQCTYCPMLGKCPASREILNNLGAMIARSPNEVRPDQVALFDAMEKPIADWFKALNKAKLKDALAGNVPPGMKVAATQPHRKWKDEVAAKALFPPEALSPPSPAQAEKDWKIPKDTVAKYAETPKGGPVLVPVSDKRPDFKQPSAMEMFGAAVAALGGAK